MLYIGFVFNYYLVLYSSLKLKFMSNCFKTMFTQIDKTFEPSKMLASIIFLMCYITLKHKKIL